MLLQTRDLTKSFGAKPVVDGVTFGLAEGSLVALIGPNGAGKTTLLNLLSGYLAPTRGEIEVDRRRIERLPAHRRVQLGVARTFQQPSFFPRLTVLENVEVALVAHARLHRRLRTRRRRELQHSAGALLETAGLIDAHGELSDRLSYGDQRRLEIAIALASRPQILMLDEPMAGMAHSERDGLSRLILEMRERHRLTVIFTEHDMDVVFALAEHVHVLHQGRLLVSGAPSDVRADARVRDVYLGTD